MKLDNKYLNKYKKRMLSIMKDTFPDEDEKEIEKIIVNMIDKNVVNPEVTLDNNFTHEQRNTSLLSVLDWMYDRKPIIGGNATFYKNQYESINPIAKMLENFLSKRKAFKKEMFKIEDTSSHKYRDLDLSQNNEKINCNSYYGASGAPSSAFYSLYSGPATTSGAQSVISTAEQMFEGFIADNYIFLNLTEAIEWCEKVISPYLDEIENIDEFINIKNIFEVSDRILSKILQKEEDDEEILNSYLTKFSDKELSVLYYKNNLQEFIEDHDYIKELILDIFENVENLDYADKKDDEWFMNVVPKEYKNDFTGKSFKDWNKFVNKQYFMDPNDPPECIMGYLCSLNEYIMKYVYCQYLSVDRIYRLKNFKRRVVTVIDTDSNILSMDTIVNYLFDNLIKEKSFGRSKENNEFIAINTLAFLLTNAVTDILLYYGECCNIPEEFRPIYNMKNEFYFSRLVIGQTKKRYISKILLREGNLMNPPKKDIKGFDFKKASCSEYAEKFYMSLITKYIIENEHGVDLKGILRELTEFKEEIYQSMMNGERTFLPNAAAKELGAYKNPASQQVVGAFTAWNLLNPDNQIELPAKVSLVKLNIFDEEDIEDLKTTNPDIYEKIVDNIFHDTTGIFVSSSLEPGVDFVSIKDKEWYKKIPKKYQAKYKKLGPEYWNEFVENYDHEAPDAIKSHYEYKSKGLQVLAIPSNSEIPEWARPYIDYSTMINNILAPFIPVLEIFKSKQLKEGRTRKGVDRSTNGFTTIVKF